MVFDILIGIIIISGMVLGYRSGFVYTFLHMIGWIVSIVMAFVWTPHVKEFLLENTGLYASVHSNLTDKFADPAGINRMAATLPDILKDMIASLSRLTAEVAATAVSDFIFTILSFLLIVIGIKLVFVLLVALLSKKNNGGVRGIVDGILGLVVGFVRGIFVVFVMLALMIPILSLFDSGLVTAVCNQLDSSYFAGTLYDSNIIALIARDFLT